MAKSLVQKQLMKAKPVKNEKLVLKTFNYRLAEQVLNNRGNLRKELEDILTDPTMDINSMTRPYLNKELEKRFVAKGWSRQPRVFDDVSDPSLKMDFLKDRIRVEVSFTHSSYLGIDLLKMTSQPTGAKSPKHHFAEMGRGNAKGI